MQRYNFKIEMLDTFQGIYNPKDLLSRVKLYEFIKNLGIEDTIGLYKTFLLSYNPEGEYTADKLTFQEEDPEDDYQRLQLYLSLYATGITYTEMLHFMGVNYPIPSRYSLQIRQDRKKMTDKVFIRKWRRRLKLVDAKKKYFDEKEKCYDDCLVSWVVDIALVDGSVLYLSEADRSIYYGGQLSKLFRERLNVFTSNPSLEAFFKELQSLKKPDRFISRWIERAKPVKISL